METAELEEIASYTVAKKPKKLQTQQPQIVPIALGTLSAMAKHLECQFYPICIDKITTSQLKKSILLGTAYVLQ